MNHHEPLENPVLGYVVVTVALLVGILSASVFGGIPVTESAGESPADTRFVLKSGGDSVSKEDPCESRNAVSRRWVLGVRAEATAAGCVIQEVIDRSAAQRAGLAPGDRIITVDGQQAGWVGNKHRPLHCLVDQSQTGHARLLVQRAHRRAIVAIRVRLKTAASELGH